MSKKVKEENKKEKVVKEKKPLTKKQVIMLAIGIVLAIILIGGTIAFVVYKNINKNNSNTENIQDVTEDNEDQTDFEKLKNDLINLINEKLNMLKELVCDEEGSCLDDTSKEEMVTKLNDYLTKINEITDEKIELLDELQKEISSYVEEIDTKVNEATAEEEDSEKDDSKTTTDKSSSSKNKTSSSKNTTSSKDKTTSSTTTSSSNKSLESLLNSAKLSPLKSGYAPVDNKVQEIINSQTNSSMSTYQKVMALYDWLTSYLTYVPPIIISEAIQEIADENSLYYNDAQELFLAENAFETRTGSCDNYSAIFMLLTRRIGLDSYTISAQNADGGGHTTVNIKLNGAWYNFDAQGDAKQKSKGKAYYFLGQDEKTMAKVYKSINRSASVSRFKKFAHQEDLLKTSITVNGKTFSTQTSKKITEKESNIMDLTFTPNSPIVVSVTSNVEVTAYWELGDDYIWGEKKDHTTKLTNGNINVKIEYPDREYLNIRLTDSKGRQTDYMIRINAIESGKPFEIKSSHVIDSTYDDHFEIYAAASNGSGEVTYSARVLDTTDPNKSNITFEKSKYYTLTAKNVRTHEYYYKIEVTAKDAKGNTATSIFEYNEK